MTILQIVLVSLGTLLVIFFLIAFFLPDRKQLSRSIIIDHPAKEIYGLITDYTNYKKWNPWSRREPEAKGELSGEPSTPGHKWEWSGKKIGSGYLQIRELEEGKFVRSDLVFTAPRKMTAEDIWKFNEIGENKTEVSWEHVSDLEYPTGRYFGLMLEKFLGPDFEQGLKNLKELSDSDLKNE